MKIWNTFLELIFPGRCPVCDKILPLGGKICPSCVEKPYRIVSTYCRKCGKLIDDEREEYCRDCRETIHFYIQGRALYEYASVRESLYRFKYKGRCEYANYYGMELAEHLGEIIRYWRPDVLVPVPLHRSRKRQRGYNQAELLARELGRRMNIPVDTKLIKRIKKTVPQKQLDRQMRQNNLKKAFKIDRNDVKLSTIIIIDDIYTTGSTVDAIARVLRETGMRNIYFIALAAGRE